MASYNRVILVGNLTRDVELRYIQSGTAVTDVGLAVNEKVKKGEEWVDEVTFVDITLWGRTAENVSQYCSKGSSLLVEGRLRLEQWQDKDGGKRSKLKVVGDKVQFLGSKREDKPPQRNEYSEPIAKPNIPPPRHIPADIDDPPF